jgi:hypothetical protein
MFPKNIFTSKEKQELWGKVRVDKLAFLALKITLNGRKIGKIWGS